MAIPPKERPGHRKRTTLSAGQPKTTQDALVVERSSGHTIVGRRGEFTQDARISGVEGTAVQRSPATRIVVYLIDLQIHPRSPQRLDRCKANRRLETGDADPVCAVLNKGAHRNLRNRGTRENRWVPTFRHPVRLVDELPRMDHLGVATRGMQERLEHAIQKLHTSDGIGQGLCAPLLHPICVFNPSIRIQPVRQLDRPMPGLQK